MEFVIITGMSGAGKTSALHVLEDIGFYCVDNIPASLLSMLFTLCTKSEDENMKRVAVVVDVRGTEKCQDPVLRRQDRRHHHPLQGDPPQAPAGKQAQGWLRNGGGGA